MGQKVSQDILICHICFSKTLTRLNNIRVFTCVVVGFLILKQHFTFLQFCFPGISPQKCIVIMCDISWVKVEIGCNTGILIYFENTSFFRRWCMGIDSSVAVKLANLLTDESQLQTLVLLGLGMDESTVDGHLRQNSIKTAAHKVLKE